MRTLCRNLRFPLLLLGAGVIPWLGCHLQTYPLPLSSSPQIAVPVAGSPDRLKHDVTHLAETIGERHVYRIQKLDLARGWIHRQLSAAVAPARATVTEQAYVLPLGRYHIPGFDEQHEVANLIAELPGRDATLAREIIVIGAHYDTVAHSSDWVGTDFQRFDPSLPGTPGANDNASGVAALLELARQLARQPLDRTVRFVAFVNEEPPFFQHADAMGSCRYAQRCRDRQEAVVMMLSLDALGVYTVSGAHDKRPPVKSALATALGLPLRADYVVFMSNFDAGSGAPTARWARAFAARSSVEVHTVSLPFIPAFGTEVFAWSDDWSFTQRGYPAFTVTDTAFFRSDRYHDITDTAAELTSTDYATFARVVAGLAATIAYQASASAPAR